MKKKILVIESFENSFSIANADLLEKYDIERVPSMSYGVHFLSNNTVDLVMWDIDLSDIYSSAIFTRFLKTCESKNLPPFVSTTSEITDEICEKAYIVGSKTLLLKPFSNGDLINKVENFISEITSSAMMKSA